MVCHYCGVILALKHLKSLATWLLVQKFVLVNNKEIINLLINCPLRGIHWSSSVHSECKNLSHIMSSQNPSNWGLHCTKFQLHRKGPYVCPNVIMGSNGLVTLLHIVPIMPGSPCRFYILFTALAILNFLLYMHVQTRVFAKKEPYSLIVA